MTPGSRLLPAVRWGALILGAVLIAARVGTHGFDRFILVSAGLLTVVGFALHHAERHTERPLKTYVRWGLAGFTLGLVLIVLPFVLDADVRIGAILWFGLAAAGLLWAAHYERSEPR